MEESYSKLRIEWGEQVECLSDKEAGIFIKAIYAFSRHGEKYTPVGAGRVEALIMEALETLQKDAEEMESVPSYSKKKTRRRIADSVRGR